MHVNSKDAETAIKAAIKKAQALKTQMCIAVVDSGANLKAFHRMDDAWVDELTSRSRRQKQLFSSGCRRARSASFHSQAPLSLESSIRTKGSSPSRAVSP